MTTASTLPMSEPGTMGVTSIPATATDDQNRDMITDLCYYVVGNREDTQKVADLLAYLMSTKVGVIGPKD